MLDDEPLDSPHGATAGAWLSIGALAKASGVPVETLRTWERRYDFPQPSRLPSGHLRYPAQAIGVVVRVRALLAEGHRASDLLSEAARGETFPPRRMGRESATIDTVLALDQPATIADAATIARAATIDAKITARTADVADPTLRSGLSEVLDAAYRLDAMRLDRALSWQWQRRGGIGFLEGFCGPLLVQIGLLWRDGIFDVHHEHFASERIRDFLVARAQALAVGAEVWVIAATISGERHVLGLHMAAAALAMAGVGVVFLGADMPVQELATAAAQVRARGVIISVSEASRAELVTAQLVALRDSLPLVRDIAVGGQGASRLAPIPGVQVLSTLPSLQGWAHSLRAPAQETA